VVLPAKPDLIAVTKSRALVGLAIITAIGGALRFYNLAWGAPYFHFHMDEHYVFMGADLLRTRMRDAALSGKFFMYGPLPMYLLDALRWVYDRTAHPLVLTVPRDEITYMVMGRAISASFGTAAIVVVYSIATRIAGRPAGLLAAAFLACSVLLVRDSHFFSVDVSMTFFCLLTWLALLRMAERGTIGSAMATGTAFAAAITCKYTAVFLAIPIALAWVAVPARPTVLHPYGAWLRWAFRGLIVPFSAGVTFVLLDPMVLLYLDKFRFDVRTQITEPLSGATRPIFFAHFFDLAHPRLYFFTNLLWWGVGPALEIAGLAGVVWLLVRRSKAAALSAIVPIAYFLVAGNTVAPFIRYAIPLATALTVAAGVLCADWCRHPRWRPIGLAVTAIVLGTTAIYAAAYMNIFRQPDSRVAAARYLRAVLPAGAKVLVEPSQNTPPIGSYFYATDFYGDYVVWGPRQERLDFVQLRSLDTYVHLYDRRFPPEEKRAYIASKLSEVDWIVMDDTYLQWYDHLPESEYGPVKQYYRDLFAGRLGFRLERIFKVHPSLFGHEINDDNSEFSFRLFDHPRVFIFKRTAAPQPQ
jgi:4-amino-4-deoxy-L-arabinose transferase-like glycosyltransferase